jgi:DNA-binding MarR family transcriptional regulator
VLEESIGYLINRLAREMQNALEKELAPHGVTAAQWSVLIRCLNDGPQPQGALGRQLAVDASAITRLVDRLVAKDLVLRNPTPGDRRSFEVALTRKGRTLAKKLPPYARRVLTQYLAGFTPAEVKQLNGWLKQIIANSGENAA